MGTSKYDGLTSFLRASDQVVITLTFTQADVLVAGGLPPSARRYEVWWRNDDPSHQHCQSWGRAGYKAEPDLRRQRVTFRRI
jgi:hypothetical protein